MDAAAYLTNQGWRGDGHALHHSGRGITKPIHISQKANVLGVGKKLHDAHADQWWARAFDDTLKGLNTTKNDATGKTDGVQFGAGAQALQMVGIGGAKWVGQVGLYSNFVRGESLSGTLTPEEKNHRDTQLQPEDQQRCDGVENDVALSAAAAKNVKRSKKKGRQQEDIAKYSQTVGVDETQQDPKEVWIEEEYQKPREKPKDAEESKEQRRQRKREKKARRALEAGGSRELTEQPRVSARNEILTSDRLKRRSKEQLHAVEDADAVVTKACNSSRDGKRKAKGGKRRRVVDIPRTS